MFGIFIKEFMITKDLKLVLFFVALMVMYWLKNKLFKKVVLYIIKRTPTTLDDDMYPLFSQLINLCIFGTVIVSTLLRFGVDVKSIMATAGVGSLAIAFALKDTLTNVLAGIMIMADRPFRIGDNVKLSSGEFVIVLDIGLRRTKFLFNEDVVAEGIKVNKDSVLIIPNVDLVKHKVYNYSYANELKMRNKGGI